MFLTGTRYLRDESLRSVFVSIRPQGASVGRGEGCGLGLIYFFQKLSEIWQNFRFSHSACRVDGGLFLFFYSFLGSQNFRIIFRRYQYRCSASTK